LFWPLLAPAAAQALVVDIQGIRLELQVVGSSCVEIAGSFPGVRIESSESGKQPRVCYNSNRVNSISFLHTVFIATAPLKKDILIKVEHGFPTGVNGKIMVRSKLQGYFSSSDGLTVPVGDKLSFTALFGQTSSHPEAVAEPFEMTVGDKLDSAMFEYSAKKQYLISGPRQLQGSLSFAFENAGDRLTLVEKSGIFLDTGSTMADKLETMEPAPAEGDETQKPAEPEEKNQELPAELPPEPAPAQKKAAPARAKKKESKASPAPTQKLDLPAEPPGGAMPFTSPLEPGGLPSH
jgi:hypothetical protein